MATEWHDTSCTFLKRGFRLVSLIVALILSTSPSVKGQQFASLHLRVDDPNGAIIAQANVSIRNIDTGIERKALSDETGIAIIPGLPAGNYRLSVEASGFNVYETSLSLTLAQQARLHVVLRIQGASENVTVIDTGYSMDTGSPETGGLITPDQITKLPILERDFIDFILLTPTATIGRSTTTAAQSAFQETELMISLGGLRETHSVFYGLDGVDYNTSTSGVQRVSPSLDWVQEFRVTNAPRAADAGMNLGGAVNTITKSGTNDLHGSVYDYLRNDQVNARNLLSAPGFSTLRFNQFGSTLGGPIQRDKSFYFLGYQGQRRAESPIFSRFILKCIDTKGCLGAGTPSINDVKKSLGLSPEHLGSILLIQDYDNAFTKITTAPNTTTTLALGYLITNVRNHNTPAASPGQGLPSSYRDNLIHDQTLYGNLFQTLNAHWSTETSLSFGRRIFHMNPVGVGYEPAIQVADELYSGGFLGGVSYYGEHYFQAKETLSWTHEAHAVKLGVEFQPIWFEAQTPYFTPGVGIFSPQSFFGTGLFAGAPFGPGTAVQFIFQEPRSEFGQQVPQRRLPFQLGFYSGSDANLRNRADQVHFWHKLLGAYGEDQWRVRPNLVLSLGARYDLDLLPSAKDLQLLGQMNGSDFTKVQPRIGLAYALRNGKTIVRANFGLYTGSFEYSSTVNNWHGASPFTAMNQPMLTEFSDPSNNLIGFAPAGMVGAVGPAAAGGAFRNFSRNGIYPAPANLKQFPLGFMKRKFPKLYSEQANFEIDNDLNNSWHLTLGYHYLHALRLNSSKSINGIPNGFLSDGRQKFSPADTNFGFALFATPTGWAIYNAGTAVLRRNFARHYSAMASYTFSKSVDVATENQLQDEPQNYLAPQLDRSVGDNDVRHRLVITFIAESPSGWIPPLRNLEFSTVNTLQSPQPYSILAGTDVNGDGFPFNDRVGPIGRNSYSGASYYDTDVRLQKSFHLTEKIKANVRTEALNLLNRVNVQAIDQVYGASEFAGPLPHHFGDGVVSPSNPTFGTPTYAGAARQFQFSLKLEF